MALELYQIFISASYLGNELIEFRQILYVHCYRQDLGWDCYLSFFAICNRVMAHDICQNFDLLQNFVSAQYHENTLTEFHQLSYICIHIDKIYVLNVTHQFSHIFLPELWLLIDAKLSFPLNILRTNWQNFTKCYICILVTRSTLGF